MCKNSTVLSRNLARNPLAEYKKIKTRETEAVMEANPWTSLFVWHDSDYRGYVRDIESAIDVIEEYAYSTHTSYVTTRATKNFGSSRLEGKQASN